MRWFFDALTPEFCVACKQEGEIFCAACRAAWWPTPELLKPKEGIDQHFFLASYRDVVLQNLLRLWKYHAVGSAREALLGIVRQTLNDYAPALPEVDAVAYVPLHWRKKNLRGFDQAEEIAKTVAETLHVPCGSLIERKRFTQQQAVIARQDRDAAEFVDVFGLVGITPTKLPECILMVDDVWTTGTTLRSAAAPLLSAGVRSVSAFTLAKG